jgi:cellulose synthase/poly-beta-1,6-N-acetylglucosamine synthase-like glycosyltransferase
LKQSILPDEIIIIDSSENMRLDFVLKEKIPSIVPLVTLLRIQASLTEARNIGVRRSTGDIVFFFDDDVILDRDYIKQVMSVFTNDREGKIGGVMGNIINVNRDVTSPFSIMRRLFFWDHFSDGKFLPSGLPTYIHGYRKTAQTEFLSGCMSAYKRKVLSEFAFDNNLGRLSGYCYMEDADMSYRVSRKYTLVYTPLAKLEHHPLAQSKVDICNKTKQLVVNHFYLFRKNMPKRFWTIFSFCFSLFGYLLFNGLFQGTAEGIIGCFQGLILWRTIYSANSALL